MHKISNCLCVFAFVLTQTGGGDAKAEKASRVKSGRLNRCDRGGRYKAGLVMISMMWTIMFISGNCALSMSIPGFTSRCFQKEVS